MKSLSTLHIAGFVAVAGSLLCVFIPTFLKNVHASRLVEPMSGLAHIGNWASAYAAGMPLEEAYPESVPRTPAQVPAGEASVDPEGTWLHPTWRQLAFRKDSAHYYSFEFESFLSAEGSHFTARAFGDLDGDGELSRFELFGETRPGSAPELYSVRIYREVE